MDPKGFHRKLAAIPSADVAGRSRLMQGDEETGVKTLESCILICIRRLGLA